METAQDLLKLADSLSSHQRAHVSLSRAQLRSFAAWYDAKNGAHSAPLSAYRPEYCQKIIDFFAEQCREPFRTVRKPLPRGKWKEVTLPNHPPFLVDFAQSIGVLISTLQQWQDSQPAFARAMEHARELRAKMLVANGLAGVYNPHSWIFAAKNLAGMTDRTDVTSKDQPMFQVHLQTFQHPAGAVIDAGQHEPLALPQGEEHASPR